MKPIMQTKFGADEGNCFAACVASMLEINIDDVPDFYTLAQEKKSHWSILFEQWLLENYEIYPLFLYEHHQLPVFYIAGGDSWRDIPHSVIYKTGEMVHDPHPDGTGIRGVEDVCLFIPVSAGKSK